LILMGVNFRSGLKKFSRCASPALELRVLFVTFRLKIVAEWTMITGPLVMKGHGSKIFLTYGSRSSS
jgi:hypothetical protein